MKRVLISLAAALALCILLTVCAGAADSGYLAQIPASRLPLARALGISLEPACGDVYLVRSEKDLTALRSAGAVVYAEPNRSFTLEANSWNIDAVHVPTAWAHQNADGQYDRRGKGVTVAIVDSGVQADHGDLNPNRILPYKDYGGNENGVDIWHGTFVAGIIAAQLDNGTGIDGVAPDVTLLPVTITSGGTSDTFTAIRGIEYAANNGADVINLSIGGGMDSLFLERTCRNAEKKGVILVAAAGNYKTNETPSEKTVVYPAGYDFVVSVSSCRQTADGPVFADEYSYFNDRVDVCAPGSKIRSLYTEGGTAVASGTSFAAPTVSAMAAIAKQTNPAIDTQTFLALLEATCTDLGEEGRDVYYGMGFVNMEAFVEKLDEEYPIRYLSDGAPAQFDSEAPASYTIADAELTLPTPVRPGCRFLGWYEDPAFSGGPVTKLPTASMGERTYYAKWEIMPNAAPAVSADAPVYAHAVPASLDGMISAVPCRADLTDWFTDPDGDALTYEITDGPGSLDGPILTFLPDPDDQSTDVPITLRASDGFGHSAEHTLTVRIDARPASQPVLTESLPAAVYDPPAELSLGLRLYDSRVTGAFLDGAAIDWRMEDEALILSIPAAEDGEHTVRVTFDAGEPIDLPLPVRRTQYVYVRADAPTEGTAAPASLDGVSSATPYAADVSGWFAEPEGRALDYEKTAGPGSLTGTEYVYFPTAEAANSDVAVRIQASDSLGHSAEHTVTVHVGALPPSQPTLADPDDMIALDLCRAPDRVPVELRLYGARVTAVRLEDAALTWRMADQTLYVEVPALRPGEYDISIEFDMGEPVAWHWHVYYSVAGPAVRADAPAGADAAPASPDGTIPAVPYAADVAAWFSGEGLRYDLVSGPGSLEGSMFTFTPEADDADTQSPVTVRAEDAYGRSAVHTVLIRTGPAPAGQPVLTAQDMDWPDCGLSAEAAAALALNGARLKSVLLDSRTLDWRMEGEKLYVAVPALVPGDYEITVEFDDAAPIIWPWRVHECPSAQFRDVARDPWYHSAVDWAVENGLMNGMASDRFDPQGDFTRAMLVTVLYRAAGSPAAPDESPFTDVAPGRYYSAAVAWAAREGIVKGMTPDRFDPDAPVTREQLVTFLFRWAGDDGVRADLQTFPDADSVSAYAKEAMAWAVGRDIVNGVGSAGASALCPRDGASRAQIAAIMMRYLTNDHREVTP